MTQKPLDRFASNYDWGTEETLGNVLKAWFWDSKLSGSTLRAKMNAKYLKRRETSPPNFNFIITIFLQPDGLNL